jgi:serine phosphatase RsbU (regulator of sigma subunit)/anti-sigma regulatory factor (Ser/Thr protein kinase)
MEATSIEPVRPAALRMAFAPDHAAAREVSMAIRNFLAEQGVAEKELFSYELCIAEASNNAIEYAEGASRKLRPIAEVLFTPSQIELRVTDHTPGFILQDKIPPPDPMVDRGRGLFIIQSVMDEVRYLRGTRENILVMRKKRGACTPRHVARKETAADPLTLERSQRQLAESVTQLANMADELQLRSETLSSIFRSCAELGSIDKASANFEGRLLIDLLHLTSANWYVLRMLSPDGRKLLVNAVSESDLASLAIDLPASSGTPVGIEANVAASRTAVRFDIRESSDLTEPLRAVGPEGTGLVCPLCFGGILVGTIAVGRRTGDFPLGKLQDEIIRTFAEFLAIQTLNLGRQKEEVRNRVVARELEIAQNIQHLLLPRTLPQLPGFSLAGGWQSAREVGGDFYDAIALDGDRLLLMIADVMGKGVPAALFATTMRGLLRGLAQRSSDPAQLLCSLNRLLYNELSSVRMFITAQIALVDLKARELNAASAGHCPLLYVPLGRRTVTALAMEGLPLGVMPDTEYTPKSAQMGPNSALLLYTDGLTDIRNTAGVNYGSRRLKAWLKTHATPGLGATDLADQLATELNHFRGEAAMDDDQAFLVLTEESSGARQPPTSARRIFQRSDSYLFPAASGTSTLT